MRLHTRRHVTRGHTRIAMVVAATAIAASKAASADVVVFSNPPGSEHFDWTAIAGQEYLDIKAAASSQPGTPLTPGVFWRRNDGSGTTVRGRNGSVQRVQLNSASAGAAHFLVGVDLGTSIPTPTGPDLTGFFAVGIIHHQNPQPEWPTTLFPEGIPKYVGVSFDLGSGLQYGWIGVVRTGTEVDAFAWGYETEPGVPILAGAGLGACCVGSVCTLSSAPECVVLSGSWTEGGSCEPNLCTAGACCIGDQCFIMPDASACGNDGGTYQGDGSTCAPELCEVSAPCLGDYNHDELVDLGDLIAFNTDWQPNIGQSVTPGTNGDFNHDGTVDLADLIAFNTDWQPNIGSPCP